jgi:hypothetical protein
MLRSKSAGLFALGAGDRALPFHVKVKDEDELVAQPGRASRSFSMSFSIGVPL